MQKPQINTINFVENTRIVHNGDRRFMKNCENSTDLGKIKT